MVAAEALERARESLVGLAGHPREEGAGVAVTRFWKAGNVDYKRVVELRGVDLEVYRGKGREEVRVTSSPLGRWTYSGLKKIQRRSRTEEKPP